jgi:hypothetical protein
MPLMSENKGPEGSEGPEGPEKGLTEYTGEFEKFEDVKEEFESRLAKYCCSKDHTITQYQETIEADLWEVKTFHINYDQYEEYETNCYCATQEIAIAEAVHLLHEEGWYFFESENILSDSVYALAVKDNKVAELLEMRQRLRNVLLCESCYEQRHEELWESKNTIIVEPGFIIKEKRQFQ